MADLDQQARAAWETMLTTQPWKSNPFRTSLFIAGYKARAVEDEARYRELEALRWKETGERVALLPYVQHKPGCGIEDPYLGCTCGLADLQRT